MGKRYTREDFERDREAREARETKEKQDRQERMEKETARRVWLRDGGREADFERQWPKLRDEARRRRVMGADQRAREAHRAQAQSRI